MDSSSESVNLDFLRTVAVLSVLFAHIELLLEERHYPHVHRIAALHQVGRWGVLMFFVHTSLVLMFSLERLERQRTSGSIYWEFLLRRVLRIYPLSVLVVLLVALFKIPVAHFVQGQYVSVSMHVSGVLANIFLVQDLWKVDSIIAPLWSLPYEMHMYLLLPLLFLFVRATRRTWPLALVWVGAVGIAIGFGIMGRMGVREFLMYIPCFLPGVVAYRLTWTRKLQLPGWLWPLVLASVTSLFLLRRNDSSAWYCCLLLGCAIPQFRELKSPIVRTVCHTVARYSYGIYLLHFLCLWLAFQGLGNIPEWLRWTVFLLTTCAFPVLTYHLVEEPMMHAHRKILPVLRAKKHQPEQVTVA